MIFREKLQCSGKKVSKSICLQVKDVEDQISQRKAEVEKLIQEMREVNMESLAISPPEESKQFLDGKGKSKFVYQAIRIRIFGTLMLRSNRNNFGLLQFKSKV